MWVSGIKTTRVRERLNEMGIEEYGTPNVIIAVRFQMLLSVARTCRCA